MRRLIANGSALESRLSLSEEAEIDRYLVSLECWRAACVAVLRSGFEQEAVAELVRATSEERGQTRSGSRARIHQRRVQDALELLEALESTLTKRGVSSASRMKLAARSARRG